MDYLLSIIGNELFYPYLLAIGLMLAFALLEILGAGLLSLADGWFGSLDLDNDFHLGFWFFDWLNLGKVPLLVLLVLFLSTFGLTGLALQSFANNTLGFSDARWVVCIVSGFLALEAVHLLGAGIAKLMPQSETSAVSVDSFIGKTATVVMGEGTPGTPAKATVTDDFDKEHSIMVEPIDAQEIFKPSDRVVLVEKYSYIFKCLRME